MKTAFSLIALLFCFTINAQVQVGSAEIPSMNNAGKLSADELSAFQKTTTLFTLQSGDYKQKDLFEQVLKKFWTVTPFLVISPDEIQTYMKLTGKYSFATFDGYAVQSRTATNTHISYDIWMPEFKNGKFKRQNLFARFALHCDFDTYTESNKLFFGKKENGTFLNYLYTKAVFSNWQPGILGAYLKTISDGLKTGKTKGVFTGSADKAALSVLKNDTLWLPDYVNVHFNMFNGNEVMNDSKDEDDAKKSYPFPIKYLPAEELSYKIMNSTKPINYLVYVKSSTDKFVSVYSSDGRELYADYTSISYNFKNKDLKKLANVIK